MISRKALPARHWLTRLVAATLAPILIVSGILVWRADRTASDAFEERALSLARQVSAAVDQELVVFQSTLQALASLPTIRRNDWQSFYAQADEVEGVRGAVVVVRDRNGQQVINTRVPFGTDLPQATDPTLLGADAEVLRTGAPTVTDLFTGTVSTSNLVAVVVPVFRSGRPEFAMSMGLPLNAIGELLARQGIPDEWTVAVLDSADNTVAAFGQPSQVGDIAAASTAMTASAPTNLANWRVRVAVPSDVVRRSVWSMTWLLILGVSAAALLATVTAIVCARSVSRPINNLARAAAALGRGDPLPSMHSSLTEANTVSQAMHEASANLQSREQSLIDEARRLDVLARLGESLVGQRDIDRVIAEALEAGRALTGATSATFVCLRDADRTVAGSDGNAAFTDSRRAALMPLLSTLMTPQGSSRAVRVGDVANDVRLRDLPLFGEEAGGAENARSLLAAPVYARAGDLEGSFLFGHREPHAFRARHADFVVGIAGQAAVAMDNAQLFREAQNELAARQRSEEDLRLVAGELEHRIKNMLAMIGAVANQTFRGSESKEDAERSFETRLGALAKAQDVLTASSWTNAPIRRIVEGALAPHGVTDGRFELTGPDFRITGKQALSLSLALHELATNATKYGALSVEGGTVHLHWGVIDAQGGQVFELLWREAGGPPVVQPSRTGFGSRLIQRTLAGDFEGDVAFLFEADGFQCRLTAPIDNIRQAA